MYSVSVVFTIELFETEIKINLHIFLYVYCLNSNDDFKKYVFISYLFVSGNEKVLRVSLFLVRIEKLLNVALFTPSKLKIYVNVSFEMVSEDVLS